VPTPICVGLAFCSVMQRQTNGLLSFNPLGSSDMKSAPGLTRTTMSEIVSMWTVAIIKLNFYAVINK
jgi:hypothetical protein